jgi:acetyl-CoA acetyltransferase
MMEAVVRVSAARTAVGKFSGSLAGFSPTEMGVATAKEAIARAGIDPSEVDQAFYGNVIHTERCDMYVSRTIAIGAGLSVDDLDVIVSNEASAAQGCGVSTELKLDPAQVNPNPNGSAVASGHLIGTSGAIIKTKLLHELQRSGGRDGAATMCIGGGQGIVLVVENLAQ